MKSAKKHIYHSLILITLMICFCFITAYGSTTRISDPSTPLEGGIAAEFYLFAPEGYEPTFTTVAPSMCIYIGDGHISDASRIAENPDTVASRLLDVPDFSGHVTEGQTIKWCSILLDKGNPYVVGLLTAAPVVEEPVVEEPIVEEPIINEPIIEEPIVETPAEEPMVDIPIAATPPVVEEPAVELPLVISPEDEYNNYVLAINNYNESASNAMSDESIDTLVRAIKTSKAALGEGFTSMSEKEEAINSISAAIPAVQAEYEAAKPFSDQAREKLVAYIERYENSEFEGYDEDVKYQKLCCAIIKADVVYLSDQIAKANDLIAEISGTPVFEKVEINSSVMTSTPDLERNTETEIEKEKAPAITKPEEQASTPVVTPPETPNEESNESPIENEVTNEPVIDNAEELPKEEVQIAESKPAAETPAINSSQSNEKMDSTIENNEPEEKTQEIEETTPDESKVVSKNPIISFFKSLFKRLFG